MLLRHQGHDALDVGDEPHVEHAVGLIDHQDIDSRQYDLATLEMVEEPAGSGDQHVNAALQELFLVAEADPADDERHGQFVVLTVSLEVLRYLVGQFAGRLDNERAGHARPRPAHRENVDHGQGKRRGLAGAGLGNAQDIAALQDAGDGLALDRGGFLVPRVLDRP